MKIDELSDDDDADDDDDDDDVLVSGCRKKQCTHSKSVY